MKNSLIYLLLILPAAFSAMATEEPEYTVIQRDGNIEIRDYKPYIIAETRAAGTLTEAASIAFPKLFGFISGANQSRRKIEMTAPVSQKAEGQKIPMTAPVSQLASDGDYLVSFTMPSSFTLETTPLPTDDSVKIRQIAGLRTAAIRYSGRWTEDGYTKHLKELEKWMNQHGFLPDGPAVWARYNPPFTLPFLRRNEVIIPIRLSRKDLEPPAPDR